MSDQEHITFDCSHDPSHPDHLVCIEQSQKKRIELSDPTIIQFLKKRYHAYYHPKRPQFLLHRYADAFLGTSVLVLVGFVIFLQFLGPIAFSKISVSLSVGSDAIISGEHSVFSVTIKNNSGTTLSDTKILLRKSETFTITEPHSEDISSSQAELALERPLAKNESRTVVMKGIAIGSIGEKQLISITVQGKTPSDELIQSEATQLTYDISDSSLDITNELPKEIVAGNAFDGSYTVVNRSSLPSENILVRINAPKGLEMTNNKSRSSEFLIKRLEAHEEYRVPVHVTVISSLKGDSSIDISLLLERRGSKIVQREVQLPLTITQPSLELHIIPVSSTSLRSGTKTFFDLTWNNSSPDELQDVVIGVNASGFGIGHSSLSSDTALMTKPSQLVWTKNQIAELKRVAAKKAGSIRFSIQPSAVLELRDISPDTSLESILYPFGSYSLKDATYAAKGESLELAVNTNVSLHSAIRYYSPEGDQIGRGPLPPVAGKTTSFYGFIDVSSSIHPIEQGMLSASVPSSIVLSKKITADDGNTSYDAAKRQFLWNIGTITPTYSQALRQKSIVIEFEYTPSTTPPINAPILTNIVLKGIDAITKDAVSISIPDITLEQLKSK